MSGDSRVIFGPGVSMSTCDVKLIDDSEYELSEEFELVLSDASDNARMGDVSSAKIIIDGPNDASTVTLGNATFTFTEDADQTPQFSSCVTLFRALTLLASLLSRNYRDTGFASGKRLVFIDLCVVCYQTFRPPLSQSRSRLHPQLQEVPAMQFEKTSYTVKEKDTVLHIPIIRTGDLSFRSSVRCFTRTMSAMVMDDFVERRNTDESLITFLKGEKVKNCTVHINDDSVFEPEEEFQLHLGTPQGDHWSGGMIGPNDIVAVTITNDEDAPTIEFEQASYQVREPPGPDGVEALNIKVIRRGDLDRTSKIRCSTRDGSAQFIPLFLPLQVVSLADYDHVQEVTKEGSKKTPSPGYPLVCVTPCDPHYPKYSVMNEHCEEAGINQTQVHFSWEVATPTDSSGARSPFETVTDTTPYTSVNHRVRRDGFTAGTSLVHTSSDHVVEQMYNPGQSTPTSWV
ncbi:hypothetical protein XENOCAPTIV_002767 [Xenoophorus captivus]|uniref:Calx-beta domain-containing protein n=1 Tax=Xenoophorus captivus TaxID=1517983 RepID=A0ABV0R6I5_9TELE